MKVVLAELDAAASNTLVAGQTLGVLMNTATTLVLWVIPVNGQWPKQWPYVTGHHQQCGWKDRPVALGTHPLGRPSVHQRDIPAEGGEMGEIRGSPLRTTAVSNEWHRNTCLSSTSPILNT